MATPSIPLVAALPQFSQAAAPQDDLISASPIYRALLSQTGGTTGMQNVNKLGALNPQWGQMLSFMSPGGGIGPQQAQQFGPLFALLMSLQGGGAMPGML